MNLLNLKFREIPIREIYVKYTDDRETSGLICVCDMANTPHYHSTDAVICPPTIILKPSEAAEYFISNYGYIPLAYRFSNWAQGHKIEEIKS
jgi:hypothetical protein